MQSMHAYSAAMLWFCFCYDFGILCNKHRLSLVDTELESREHVALAINCYQLLKILNNKTIKNLEPFCYDNMCMAQLILYHDH